MDTFLQDFRYGVRNLLRQRGSSIVAVVTLALGIGASTAIFSVVDAAMLRPLPYPKPEQLVSVNPEQVLPDGKVSRATASMEDMRFMQKADDIFSQVAAWGSAFRGRVAEGPEPERIQVAHYTEDYLPMHGVTPQAGRTFTLADMQPDAPLVALLGHGYWQSRFGGRDVLGQTIRLEEDIAEIVGVLPPWFNASTPVSIPHRDAAGGVRPPWHRPGVDLRAAARRHHHRTGDASGCRRAWRIGRRPGGGKRPAGVGRARHLLAARRRDVGRTDDGQHPPRRGRADSADCVRQRRRPAAGARRRAPGRAGGARVARRRPLAADPPGAHRERRAGDSGGRARRAARLADARRDRRQHPAVAAVELAGHAEPHRPRV